MPTCLIALGSNLGDRQATLRRAVERLCATSGIDGVEHSGWHATPAIGGPPGQGEFLNGAVRLETELAPEALFAVLRQIERQLGRRADQRWAPRTLDLDLLLYGAQVIELPGLVVPHPRMSFRRFVLAPAAEVAADMEHPTIGWTVAQLLQHLDAPVDYVAIAGPAAVGKTWLAEQLHARFGGRLIRHVVDPSGQAYDTELRLLAYRAEQLDRRLGLTCSAGSLSGGARWFVVSDFWFDQSLSYAGHWLDGEAFERFRVAWQAAGSRVLRPKLLVVLDAARCGLARRGHGVSSGARPSSLDDRARLGQAILDRARMPGHGPTLWLSGPRRDEALAEAVAAVEAMR